MCRRAAAVAELAAAVAEAAAGAGRRAVEEAAKSVGGDDDLLPGGEGLGNEKSAAGVNWGTVWMLRESKTHIMTERLRWAS